MSEYPINQNVGTDGTSQKNEETEKDKLINDIAKRVGQGKYYRLSRDEMWEANIELEVINSDLKQRLDRARERVNDLIQHFTDELTCRVTDIDMAEEEGWEYPDGENGYHVEWHRGQRDMARDIVKRLKALADMRDGGEGE